MANTTIQLKKSSVPSSVPSSLEFGELAINYADGKLYYKNTSSEIVEFIINAGDTFSSVNANGVLIIADTPSDILTLEVGENINIVGDAINDKITISANIAPAFDKANAANVLAFNTGAGANAYATSVGTAGNAYTQTVGAAANGWANTISDTRAAAANGWANTKLSNTTTTFAGTLTITNDLIVRGNATLGDASTDTITLNGSTISLGNNQSIDSGTLFIDAVNNEVGIGITSPTSNLHVIGTANITSNLVIGGSVTAIDFNSVSDASLKENIDSITDSYQILSQINPVSFQWKNNGIKSYGVLAQEVEKILPEIVATNDSGIKSVSYIQLIALLIDSTNSLQKEMEEMKSTLSKCDCKSKRKHINKCKKGQ